MIGHLIVSIRTINYYMACWSLYRVDISLAKIFIMSWIKLFRCWCQLFWSKSKSPTGKSPLMLASFASWCCCRLWKKKNITLNTFSHKTQTEAQSSLWPLLPVKKFGFMFEEYSTEAKNWFMAKSISAMVCCLRMDSPCRPDWYIGELTTV